MGVGLSQPMGGLWLEASQNTNAAHRGMPILGHYYGRDSLHNVQPVGRYLRKARTAIELKF